MNRIQSPVTIDKKNTAYEQQAVAGTGMEVDGGGGNDLGAQWNRVCDRLRKEIGDKAFKTWFGEVEPGELKAGKLRLYAPTRFVRDWVARHYGDRVLAYWQAVNGEVASVEVNLVPPPAPRRASDVIAIPPVPSSQSHQQAQMPRLGPAIGRGSEESFQGPEARYTFANFVVGKPNEFAYAAARNIAEQDRPLPERNPLYIFGGVGLGKTHLMHAVWHSIRERDPKQRVLYLTAEHFVNRFIQALRNKNTGAFKEMFRNVDVLMVDDVQFICGKDASQEEFFFTFNSLVEQGKQIVLSSEKPPSELQDIEERMRSRLGSGLVADIHSSTYELRLSILQTKAETARVPMPMAVLEFLAHKINTNIRELEGALHRVVAHGQLIGREITVEMAQDVLHDLLRQADRKVTVDEIQQRVAQHYNIKLAEMSSPRRARSVARPRQVAMYLAKQLTTLSLPQIGKRFGNRDHTTVMHAVRKIEELKGTDMSIAEDVELLKRQLQG
ncbi:chromosomal replication initiator protein DnaA [Reyranella sp.]|uniref:chromosomal replication initiator protein DnaA n=1 Tax=Reyranella sp. TaxID=1929291 RepID=UPI003D0A752A